MPNKNPNKKIKSKGIRLNIKWTIIPLSIIFFLLVLFLSVIFFLVKVTTDTSTPPHATPTDYVLYKDPTYGFSIEYPQAWEIKIDTQVFENGDVIAFRKKGPTQKENTELTDGAQLAISKPFTINTDLETWVKEYFGKQAEFSKITLSKYPFEKVYTCSNGCMTYYFTMIRGIVYGIAVFAQAPDSDKMVYENAALFMLESITFPVIIDEIIPEDEAILMIKDLPEVKDYLKRVPNGLVSVNGKEGDEYMIQVYEIKDGHTATFNWYKVNKTTGKAEKQF